MDTKRADPGDDVVMTEDGSLTLRHPEHGECYHSSAGAALEARELYLRGSGIELRWTRSDPVAVLDVGLGLGYNALQTIMSWRIAESPPDLFIQSLEVDALLVASLASGYAPWQVNWPTDQILAARALQRRPDGWSATMHHPRAGSVCDWVVTVGDARTAKLAAPKPGFAYVWQDAFSPSKSPTLWEPEWFAAVAAASEPGAVLMTYSVARAVRDALAGAGWCAEKITAALAAKRHWLRATKT